MQEVESDGQKKTISITVQNDATGFSLPLQANLVNICTSNPGFHVRLLVTGCKPHSFSEVLYCPIPSLPHECSFSLGSTVY